MIARPEEKLKTITVRYKEIGDKISTLDIKKDLKQWINIRKLI